LPYSTPADIRAIIHTDLSDAEISDIITQSDAEIDRRIGPQLSDPLITKLSALITARTIKHRQPTSFTVGEYRTEKTDDLTPRINDILRLLQSPHVEASPYRAKEEST